MALQIEQQSHEDSVVLALSGSLDVDAAAPLLRAVRKLARGGADLVLDLSAVQSTDTVGVAALAEVWTVASRRGSQLRAIGANAQLRETLAASPAPADDPRPRPAGLLERWGDGGLEHASAGMDFLHLLADTAYWALIAPLRRRLPPPGATTEQAVRIGVEAVPIVGLTAMLLGTILTFLGAHQLLRFGLEIFVPQGVGIGMVRELGPVITAILVVGRSGSAIAAELGTMTVGEEIDALRTMAIDPIRYLVVPRVYAISLTLPVLTLFSMFIGVFGAVIIGMVYLGMAPNVFLKQVVDALTLADLFHGLAKSLLFAWVIVMAACHYGLRITGGATGVGRATILSVVTGIFSIIVVDSIWAILSTVLG